MPVNNAGKGWSVKMQAHERRQQRDRQMVDTRLERNRLANQKSADEAPPPVVKKAPPPPPPKVEEDPTDSMTAKQLRAVLESRGLTVPLMTAKARLVEIYKETKDMPVLKRDEA